MIGLHNRQTLIARIRPDQSYSQYLLETASGVLDIGDRLSALRDRLTKDNGLSDVGRRARLAEEAKTTLARELAKASEPVRKGLAHIKASRESLRQPVPNRNDAVGEMRRMEIRAHLASLPAEKRPSAAFELAQNAECETAILDAPAALCGLLPEHHERLAADRVKRLFATELQDIAAMEADYASANAAVEIVRGQLRDAAGLHHKAFEEIMSPLEAEPVVTPAAPQAVGSPYEFDRAGFHAELDSAFAKILAA